MKKALILILSVILAAGLAFASWEETRTEGNPWRPEGEILLYSLVRGTYSDASVEKAPSDVSVNIEIAGGSDYPYVVWRLDAHKGDLGNSILDYGEKSSATISIRDDSGAVTVFNTKNLSYGTYWNVLRLDDGRAFTKLLMVNGSLEVGIFN